MSTKPGTPMRSSSRVTVCSVEWDHGSVVNLSSTGACLLDRRPDSTLSEGEDVRITLATGGRTIEVNATPVWSRASDAAGGTLLGVSFEGASNELTERLEHLASVEFPSAHRTAESTSESMSDDLPSTDDPDGWEAIDLYKVLGVRRDAGESQIRCAFRKEAARWHPDTCKSPDAAEQFITISKAYRVLKDASSRRRYDELIGAPAAKPAASAPSNDDRRGVGRIRCEELECSLGEVVNASSSGLQIRGPKRRSQRTGKQVKFTLRDGKDKLDLRGVICWVADDGRKACRVGIALELNTPMQRARYWEFVRNAASVASSTFRSAA